MSYHTTKILDCTPKIKLTTGPGIEANYSYDPNTNAYEIRIAHTHDITDNNEYIRRLRSDYRYANNLHETLNRYSNMIYELTSRVIELERELKERKEIINRNPFVKDAYEQYITALELARE